MRCLACNTTLNEVACRRKMKCGEHWDLCGSCYMSVREVLDPRFIVEDDSAKLLREAEERDGTLC